MMKDTAKFGEFVRRARLAKQITGRDAAEAAGMLPSNFSKMEHGLLNPPKEAPRQKALADVLGLAGSERDTFFDLAGKAVNAVPVDIAELISAEEAVPLLLRTIGNKRLNPAAIKRLVEIVRGASRADKTP